MVIEKSNAWNEQVRNKHKSFTTKIITTDREKQEETSGIPTLITIPKSVIIALLITLFFLAYVITPYWDMPGNSNFELIIRDLTLVLGILWSVLGAGEVNFKFSKLKIRYFLPFFLVILLFNLLPLISVIPWRGDEERHIAKTLEILNTLPWYIVVLGTITWGVVIYLSRRKPRYAIIVGVILLFFMITNSIQFDKIEYTRDLVRYPYVSYWAYAWVISFITPIVGHPYHEVLFRIIPFLSVLALAWTYQRTLPGNQRFSRLLWGISVALIPSLFYYTSILYLEMPAVQLMTIVCLRIEKLLKLELSELKRDPGWYALILVGFIKETTLPFLLCFLLFRTTLKAVSAVRVLRSQKLNKESLFSKSYKPILQLFREELIVFFVLLIPVLYYFAFRLRFNPREYQLTLTNIADPSIYPVVLHAFFEQFGAWILLFIAGCIFLIVMKKYSILFFFCSLFFGYLLFFGLDQKIYIGYSRFYLFLLPPILAAAFYLIRYTMEKRKYISFILLAVVLITSLILSPIQRDGTKIPYWGNYLFDTSEHYYPVDKALMWMKENDPNDSVLFAGFYYRYFYNFYFLKYNWRPDKFEMFLSDVNEQNDQVNLLAALTKAEGDGFNNILFFVLGEEIPRVPENSNFRQKIVFSNMSHILVLYTIN